MATEKSSTGKAPRLEALPPITQYSHASSHLEAAIAKAQALAHAQSCFDFQELPDEIRANYSWVLSDLLDEIKDTYHRLHKAHHEEYVKVSAIQLKAVGA